MTELHGGNIYDHPGCLDFSASINPLGMPQSVREAVINSIDGCVHYPQCYCDSLRKVLSEKEGIPADNIICGNGAADLIFRIVNTLKPEGGLVCRPGFIEYERALQQNRSTVYHYVTKDEDDFRVNESFIECLTPDTGICFLCTPNNPTGALIEPDLLEYIARKLHEKNIVLVCDESFIDFTEKPEEYSMSRFLGDNCVILRSFTKIFAIPGLRFGYAVCGNSSHAAALQYSGQSWSVSVPAQAAAVAAAGEDEFIKQTVDYISKERCYLTAAMRDMGLRVLDSAANFIMFRCKAGLAELMEDRKILIRTLDLTTTDGQGWYRIAVRTHEENIRLLSALKECIYG